MKKSIPVIFLLSTVLLAVSCRPLREMSALKECEFSLGGINDYRLAGIKLERMNGYADLSFSEIGLLTRSMASGDLPLSLKILINVHNPNTAVAGLNRLEYIAFIDGVEIARGTMNEAVRIEPGRTAEIPLSVKTNLLEAFKKESIQALFNLVLNLADAGDQPTKFQVRIKPTIQVGKKDVVYPGYIRVHAKTG